MEQIKQAVENTGAVTPWAFVLATAAGLVLAFSPSILALAPVVMSIVASGANISRPRAVFRSTAFVVGTATTFAAYGLVSGWAGSRLAPLFGANGYLIAGLVLILLGAALAVRLRIRLPMQAAPQRRANSVIGAYFLGIPFGLVGST